mgnify:CR=1 FL=1
MTLAQIAQPGAEPVSLEEAKAHLRVDGYSEDALIDALIGAARAHLENVTNRALVQTKYRLDLPGWPVGGVITLPRPPLQAVTAIQYVDDGGELRTLASDQYQVTTPSGPCAQRGTVRPAYGVSWPSLRPQTNAVQVSFTAGYAACPKPLRAALLMLLAHLYESREAAAVGSIASVETPFGVRALLAPYVSREVLA